MTDNPYQVLGNSIPSLMGRKQVWKSALSRLGKKTPDNLVFCGPRHIGKQVFLQALARHFANGQQPFSASVHWNLRQDQPQREADFFRFFAAKLASAITTSSPHIADVLRGKDGENWELLKLAFETLYQEKRRILVVLSQFDSVLVPPLITSNILDNFRYLADSCGVTYVLGTKRPLSELYTPESRGSPFFNLFLPNSKRLGPFDEEDWDDILLPFTERNIRFGSGARTELINWTGGIPILVGLFCRTLWETAQDSTAVTPQQINELAPAFLSESHEILSILWQDCTEDERGDLAELAIAESLGADMIPASRCETLIQRGLVESHKGKITFCCRAMERYASEHGQDTTALHRLFARSESYHTNIGGVLELRFKQLQGVDEELVDFMKIAVEDADKPHVILGQIRNVENRAFELLWDTMQPPWQIPTEWTQYWKEKKWQGARIFEGNIIPNDLEQQRSLLRDMIHKDFPFRLPISRPAGILLHNLHLYGNIGVHPQGNNRPLHGVAIAVCLSAIELCEHLTRDLKSGPMLP